METINKDDKDDNDNMHNQLPDIEEYKITQHESIQQSDSEQYRRERYHRRVVYGCLIGTVVSILIVVGILVGQVAIEELEITNWQNLVIAKGWLPL